MVIDVSWGNPEKTYIYIRVVGKWGWDDYHSSLFRANKLIRTVDHKVCVITHLTNAHAQTLPSNAFAQWSKSLRDTPPNMQTLILVPGRPIVQSFIDMTHRLLGRLITFRFRMASTLEDAIQIVEDTQDKTISQVEL